MKYHVKVEIGTIIAGILIIIMFLAMFDHWEWIDMFDFKTWIDGQ